MAGVVAMGLPGALAIVVEKPSANAGDIRDAGQSLHQEDALEEAWQPTPVSLPGESQGQRSLVGYSPWGRKESDTTEHTAHTHKTVNW